jgi:predicted transcriptional regulator
MKLLSTKTKQQQIEWRRDRVLELSSQGFSQTDIATVLHVAKSIISKDMARLKQQARENLQHHIHETIPAEYQKAVNTLNQVLRMSWSIVGKTEDEKTRLQALALINDVNKYRTELVTNGVIVHDSLQIIQSKMEHINGNGKDKGKAGIRLDPTLNSAQDEVNAQIGEEQEEEPKTTNGVF